VILVVGATGVLGGLVAAGLLGRALPVRVLVHLTAPTSLQGAELVHGDLAEPATLLPALAGVETVIVCATGMARRLAGPGPSVRRVDGDGVGALVDEAERAGVRRVVYVSFAGVDRGFGAPLDRARLATEQRLAASGMRTVVVRPDAFQESHLAPVGRFDLDRRRVSIIGTGDNPRRWVAVDDVAALVIAVATEEDPPALIEFGGPQALSRRGAVLSAEGTLGEHLRVRHLPRPAARLGIRVFENRNDAVASVLGIGLALDLVEARWDDAPLTERGVRPRPASAYLRRQALAVWSQRHG
jgi:uncharacterized protein YbjT (DUF2867 family)